ncbi:MAG: hypothetical protein ABIH50_03950 [bacterium]
MKKKTWLGVMFLVVFCLAIKASYGDAYQFERSWGNKGEENGQFDKIIGVALDPAGKILVGDSFKIQAFDQNGNFIAKVYEGELRGFTVANNKLHVADWCKTKVLSLNGQTETEFGTIGEHEGQFNIPGGIAVDPSGCIYVSEPGDDPANPKLNHRIQKFSADGTYVKQWGSFGRGEDQIYHPLFLAVHPSGVLFVNDESAIKKYSLEGELIGVIRQVKVANKANRFVARGITFDHQGNLFIADKGSLGGIYRTDENGDNGIKFGGYGEGDGQFASAGPQGIAVDSVGNVYVGDPGHYKVHKYRPASLATTPALTKGTESPGILKDLQKLIKPFTTKDKQKKITVKSPAPTVNDLPSGLY